MGIIINILFSFSLFLFWGNNSELSKYLPNNNRREIIALPFQLREVSGIAATKDGRLFAINDEEGIIYQVNPTNGKIIKSFSIGEKIIKEDFEDLTIVNNKFFAITSTGFLYEFNEGKDKSYSEYDKYFIGLTPRYNLEGLCYDERTGSLLIACKDFPGKGYEDYRTCYSYSLKEKKLDFRPRFILPEKEITDKLSIKNFKPSGICKIPDSHNFFVISAKENAIIEISQSGKVLAQAVLPKEHHFQPEGITFLPDKTLLISDEGIKFGSITKYKFKN